MDRLKTTGTFTMLALMCAGVTYGQSKAVSLTVNDPRPLAAASDKIEQLSFVPVNYEDAPYTNAADLKDVTDEVLTPTQRASAGPGFHIIGPRGGELSASVLVDATTSRLASIDAAQNAADLFVDAQRSSYGQGFMVERNDGMLFVRPTIIKNRVGAAEQVTPILSTPITFAAEQRLAFQTLKIILDLVSSASGVQIDPGTIPIGAFATLNSTVGADNEPARDVLVRLFQQMSSPNDFSKPLSVPSMSYRLFFDPTTASYALNVHFVPGPAKVPASLPSVAPSTDNGFFTKTGP